MKTVLLKDGTVGKTEEDCVAEDEVIVQLHDENGNPVTKNGIVEEILEDE